MILVFGATGNVGREVVTQLGALGRAVRAFAREPRRAAFGPDVHLVRGDLSDLRSITAAMDGVDRVFMLSAGAEAVTHDGNVARAMREAGVRRVVKLSSIAARPPLDNSYAHAHAVGERCFQSACPEWTILRPAAFMSNVLQWIGTVRTARTVHRPFGKIPRALIDPRDVAAVAVHALTTDGHGGQVYELTGPAALTMPEQVDRLAAALGRQLSYVDMPASAAAEAMTRVGMDPALADAMLASQGDPDPARGGTPLPTVERLIGRPPRTFEAWLTAHVPLFR